MRVCGRKSCTRMRAPSHRVRPLPLLVLLALCCGCTGKATSDSADTAHPDISVSLPDRTVGEGDAPGADAAISHDSRNADVPAGRSDARTADGIPETSPGDSDSFPDEVVGDVGAPADVADTGSDLGPGKDIPQDSTACLSSCDDGNVCNGAETCDPATGCMPGAPLACDDGNVCNGKETCDPAAGCKAFVFPACPTAPPECGQAGGSGAPTKNKLVTAQAGGFRLYDENTWAAKDAIIDGLVAQSSIQQVTLDDVLANLNRVATKVSGVSGTECFHTGFVWNSGDAGVDYWYPQGLTGSADAYSDGTYNGRKLGIVSWYHKPEVEGTSFNKGVRLALYDVTSMSDIKYRLLLLVEPIMNGTTPDFKAVPIHAGGMVWFGDLLYVADTTNGLRVFDMGRILQVQTGNSSWIGKVSNADGYHAFNYLYVVPQVSRYKLCSSSCCTRFSFVSLDRSTTPFSLLSGEYTADSITGRVVRWPLDSTTGLLALTDGRVQATEAFFPGIDNIQGALSWKGQYFFSCSGNVLGLYTAKSGQSLAKRDWPYGPEDLHYSPASDNLWCLTEHPGSRYVFAVKLASITAGCP